MARPKADLFVQVIALCRRIDALATLRVANLIKKRKEIEIILLKNAKIVQNGSLPENRCIGVFARCELKRFMSVFLQRLESAALPRGHEPLYCEPNKKGRK